METNLEYVAEKRVAVVMYGGVSLAIYMGGVAQELLNVVRATAPAPRDPAAPDAPLRPGVAKLTPLEAVYRKAATAGNKLTAVTIDVIAGTSAGGINGIFLAKALAHDLPMKPILKLWIEEGDLAKLLNDGASLQGTSLSRQEPPAALLNGQRMYLKLVKAFDEMDDAARGPQFDAGRVDLFVTTTDIPGEVVRLPVDNNAAAQERMHKQRFHFAAGTQDRELAREQNPLLAFAARCTSSFPVAFEPFTWNDAADLAGKRADGLPWKDRLLFVGDRYEERPFADGGVLDNKPFTYAVDELSKRQSHLEVERMLVYVEPDPQKFDRARAAAAKPSAFETALFSLTIPAEQTIRNDLQAVVERNQRIAKLTAVEREVRDALNGQNRPPRLSKEEWLASDMALLVKHYGLQYPAYHRIKVDSVVAGLSEMICANASIGRPELMQVIRELVVAWLHRKYPTVASELQLLLDADLDYRLRKLSFLLRLLNEERKTPEAARAAVALRRKLQRCYDHVSILRSRVEHDIGDEVATLRASGRVLSDENLDPIARAENMSERSAAIDKLLASTELGERLAAYLADQNRRKELAAISNSIAAAVGLSGLADVAQAYQGFESYDMVIYPLTRRGDVDEAVPVKILRVSPLESSVHRDAPLAGKQLGHFGAFLDDGFRHNDITWGRLDAASVILRQLAPDEATARQLIEDAHAAIIVEQLESDLQERLLKGSLPPRLRRTALEQIGDPDRLLAAFTEGKVYDLRVDGVHQLASAGRAGVILEKITRSWALQRNLPLPKFIAYGVLGLASLAQVAIPRSFSNTIAKYAAQLLFLAFALLGVIGALGKEWSIARAGAEGAAVVALLGMTVLAIRAAAGERLSVILFKVVQAALTAAAAVYGIWALLQTPSDLEQHFQWLRWGPMDTLAVKGALLGVAVVAIGLFLRDVYHWVRARPRLF